MTPTTIKGETRSIGKPANWDTATMGECGALSVRDGLESGAMTMTSLWFPTPSELKALNNGYGVALTIWGNIHPVVSVGTEPPATKIG